MKFCKVKEQALSQLTKQSILQYIQSMDLSISNKLPREELLAQELGVSRITVRSALNELASEGIIFRKQGKGTFVNQQALGMNVVFNPIGDLRDVIANSGYEVKTEVLSTNKRLATDDEAKKLQLDNNEEVFIVERMFYANEMPAIYCVGRIPVKIVKENFLQNCLDMSIYKYFSEFLKRTIIWDKVELSTITNQELSSLTDYFKCEQITSFLNCDIINFDNNDEPVFYANEYVDTKFIHYQLIRQKKY